MEKILSAYRSYGFGSYCAEGEKPMSEIKINVDSYVKFRPTDRGKKELKIFLESLKHFKRGPDKEGYYTVQMWILFHQVGDTLDIGFGSQIENEIIIIEE